MAKDLHSNVTWVHMLDPQSVAATTSSAWLDMKGAESAEIALVIGDQTSCTDTNKYTPSLQESATTADSDASSVDSDDMIGSFSAITGETLDSTTQTVGYTGTKRYIRVTLTEGGSGASVIAGVVGVKGDLHSAPTTAGSTTNVEAGTAAT